MDRRNFFKIVSASGVAIAAAPVIKASDATSSIFPQDIPQTNIEDAKKIPRTKSSMPGRYPAKVVVCHDEDSIKDDAPDENAAYRMLSSSMMALTGCKKVSKAWRKIISPKDIIGLKVNPIGGKLLSTSHAVVQSVVRQLEEAGVPRKNIIIWDRREEDLRNCGFTSENYPGIRVMSTEYLDLKGSFYDADGKLYGESRIDKDHYFYADVEEEYDAYTIPYMINSGKYSYFSKIVTQEVTKIINIPVMKNAGSSVTTCMKNLAFGSISNTSRLHKQLWHHTCAYVCAFPPLRDKVVLNIIDGIRGCFDGGPAANPQFICDYKTLMVGTDPVAVDSAAYDMVIKKRIEEGVQKSDTSKGLLFAKIAQELGLGTTDCEIINI